MFLRARTTQITHATGLKILKIWPSEVKTHDRRHFPRTPSQRLTLRYNRLAAYYSGNPISQSLFLSSSYVQPSGAALNAQEPRGEAFLEINGQNSNRSSLQHFDRHGYAAEFPPLGATMVETSSHLVFGPTGIVPNFPCSHSTSFYRYAGSPSILQDSLVDQGSDQLGIHAYVHKAAALISLGD